MREFKCKDAGHACDWKTRGASDDEVMRAAKEHGRSEHGLKDQDMPDDALRPLVHDIA